jgi:hypothetical protein|tara:strand:- start:1197 stop:1481 length:285 start_codon:yes stop_codon:yes gene_type:complete
MSEAANHPKVRRFKLSVDELETLDDVKKILDLLDIRLQTDNPVWEEVGQFFKLECVPKGYMKLRQKIGDEGIAELHYHEIEREAKKLLDEEENV